MNAYIIAAKRSAVGKAPKGKFKSYRPDDLASDIIQQIMASVPQLDKEEIAAYVSTGEPLGKAGAYAIQGKGAFFVEKIEGSYSGIVGLPIEALYMILRSYRIDVL